MLTRHHSRFGLFVYSCSGGLGSAPAAQHFCAFSARRMVSCSTTILHVCSFLSISVVSSDFKLAFSTGVSKWKQPSFRSLTCFSFVCERTGAFLATEPMISSNFKAICPRTLERKERKTRIPRLLMSEPVDVNQAISDTAVPDIPTGPDAFYSPMEVP